MSRSFGCLNLWRRFVDDNRSLTTCGRRRSRWKSSGGTILSGWRWSRRVRWTTTTSTLTTTTYSGVTSRTPTSSTIQISSTDLTVLTAHYYVLYITQIIITTVYFSYFLFIIVLQIILIQLFLIGDQYIIILQTFMTCIQYEFLNCQSQTTFELGCMNQKACYDLILWFQVCRLLVPDSSCAKLQ